MSRFLPFLAVALACNANVDARPRQPNIVLIVAEDMGCDLGCYGCPFLQTPHIDQFATEGVLFENAYTTQASCSPSRSSIFTGLYPHENGQIGLKKRGGNACDYMMHRGIPKLPELLRKHGYHTVLMGKIDVAPEEELAFDQRLWKWDTNPYYYDRVVAEFLDEAPQQPFFLMVNLKDAHKVPVPGASGKSDYVFPRGYDGTRLAKQDVQLPSWYGGIENSGLWKEAVGYYEAVLRVDHAVGLINKQIDEHGLGDRTCVVFITDHGTPVLRAKTTIYESGVKIPLVMKWPGRFRKGLRSRALVSVVDLLPTFLELGGGTPPTPISGRSLVPLCQGEHIAWRETLCCEWTADLIRNFLPQRSVRNHRYKLIENTFPGRRKNVIHNVENLLRDNDRVAAEAEIHYKMLLSPPAIELYDLTRDPNEWTNLAADPELEDVKQELMAQLRQWQRDTHDFLICDAEKWRALAEMHQKAKQAGGPIDMRRFQEEWADVRRKYREK